MIGHRVYPMHLQYSSREYDCIVTFLKVSDISVPLHSRSFPSAGSPPGSGALPFKRFLKLTTLYGTGQQEIGEFQIAGSECDIRHRRTYKFFPTDSVSITKLHIYVDEVCNSGLTGHVTIDLKEFIGEDESEIYLEYPLSARSPRHHAKLQLVVQCKGPHVDDNDDVLDMDLETFLYDEFPDSLLECPEKEREVGHRLRPAGSVGENNPDAVRQQQECDPSSQSSLDGFQLNIGSLGNADAVGQQECWPSSPRSLDGFQSKFASLDNKDAYGQDCGPSSQCSLDEFQPITGSGSPCALGKQQGCGDLAQIPSLKDFEANFLGLDTSFEDFVSEYAQTRPFLVTGGQVKKGKDGQMRPRESRLHAAVFFAAGVTMQQRLQSFESNALSVSLRAIDHGASPISRSSRVLLRSQSDEFDVKRVLFSPEIPQREAASTVEDKATLSRQNLNDSVRDSTPGSPSQGTDCGIESLQVSPNEAKGRGPNYVQRPSGFVACPVCSSAESRIQTQDTLPVHGNLMPDDEVYDDSTVTTSADEETQSLIPGPSSEQRKRSAVVVVRNILGILLIAGVSFVLGAQGGKFLGDPSETYTDGSGSKWSEIQQMGQFKESVISYMSKGNYDGKMGGRQPGGLPENHPPLLSSRTLVADKIGLPGQQREVALSSPAQKQQAELRLRGAESEDVREPDRRRANLNSNRRLKQDPASSITQTNKRIEQSAAPRVTNSLYRQQEKADEERVEHLFGRKMLIPLL